MDPFDEFEMKPLTEGLGFHKKAIKINREAKKPGSLSHPLSLQEHPNERTSSSMAQSMAPSAARGAQNQLQDDRKTLEKIMAALDTPAHRKMPLFQGASSDVMISEPLPREEIAARKSMEIETPTDVRRGPPPRGPAQPAPAGRGRSSQKPSFSDPGLRRSAHDSAPPALWKPAPVSVASALLDGILVIGLALVFLVTLLVVTKVNLMTVLGNVQQDFTTQLSFALLYLAVMQMYVVVSRSFFGKTLGEWTFDFQMGDEEQIKKGYYPLLVVWRSIVIFVTGVFVLPLLSLICRRDLASYLTGLQLYRRA